MQIHAIGGFLTTMLATQFANENNPISNFMDGVRSVALSDSFLCTSFPWKRDAEG